MKKYFDRGLSAKDKEFILRRIIQGEKISRISREIHISRTTLYKWLRERSGRKRNLSKRTHWRKISGPRKRRIIKLALKFPDYSIRKISSRSGTSVGFVWSCLKEHSLNTQKERQEHFFSQGTSLYRSISSAEKVIMIDRYIEGESVTRICRDFGISRTIFYNWVNKYIHEGNKVSVFQKSRPRGRTHWRYIRGIDEIVLSLVAKNPDLSISKLHARIRARHEKVISRSGLYYVLKRHDLTTYRKRLACLRAGGLIGIWDRYLLHNISLYIQLVLISGFSFIVGFGLLVFDTHLLMALQSKWVIELYDLEESERRFVSQGRKEELKEGVRYEKSYEERYETDEIIYIVRAGDTLWDISEEIYESGYNWVDVASVNKLANPDIIDIGQRLVIPVVEAREITLMAGK